MRNFPITEAPDITIYITAFPARYNHVAVYFFGYIFLFPVLVRSNKTDYF